MAPDISNCTAGLEDGLLHGLSALAGAAHQVGAENVSVLLWESSDSIRIVYHWPEPAMSAGFAGAEVQAALEKLEGPGVAGTAIAQFLNQGMAPAAASFLLVPWPEQRFKVIIAFGFASRQSACVRVPTETSAVLQLAALATWVASEVRRLRRNLHVVNERLGHRKVVERAKGLLQTEHGWSEPEAYAHLRKLSRQRRATLAETAQGLLRSLDGP